MAATLVDSGTVSESGTGSGTLATLDEGIWVVVMRPTSSTATDDARMEIENPAASSVQDGILTVDDGATPLVAQATSPILVATTATLTWAVDAVVSSVEWDWELWRVSTVV